MSQLLINNSKLIQVFTHLLVDYSLKHYMFRLPIIRPSSGALIIQKSKVHRFTRFFKRRKKYKD